MRLCAVCAAERLLALVQTSTPGEIAHRLIRFPDRNSRIGVTGSLLLLWSFNKAQDDTESRRTANRIGRVLEELKRIHGDVFYLGSNPKSRAA